MKKKEILILLPLLAMVICSCEKNDPVDDWASIGHDPDYLLGNPFKYGICG